MHAPDLMSWMDFDGADDSFDGDLAFNELLAPYAPTPELITEQGLDVEAYDPAADLLPMPAAWVVLDER